MLCLKPNARTQHHEQPTVTLLHVTKQCLRYSSRDMTMVFATSRFILDSPHKQYCDVHNFKVSYTNYYIRYQFLL